MKQLSELDQLFKDCECYFHLGTMAYKVSIKQPVEDIITDLEEKLAAIREVLEREYSDSPYNDEAEFCASQKQDAIEILEHGPGMHD